MMTMDRQTDYFTFVPAHGVIMLELSVQSLQSCKHFLSLQIVSDLEGLMLGIWSCWDTCHEKHLIQTC